MASGGADLCSLVQGDLWWACVSFTIHIVLKEKWAGGATEAIRHHLSSQRLTRSRLMGLCMPLTMVRKVWWVWCYFQGIFHIDSPMCPSLICSHGRQRPQRDTWRFRGDEETWSWKKILKNLLEISSIYSDLTCSNFHYCMTFMHLGWKCWICNAESFRQNWSSFMSSLGIPAPFAWFQSSCLAV